MRECLRVVCVREIAKMAARATPRAQLLYTKRAQEGRALGKDCLEGFLAGVEAETANIELATAATTTAAAAAAAAVTAAIATSPLFATVASARGITCWGRAALLTRGAARTLPATFVSLGHCVCS